MFDFVTNWAAFLRDLQIDRTGFPVLLFSYVILYPLALSFLWTIYGLEYLRRRRREPESPATADLPGYTVLIPFHAEYKAALRSARSLQAVVPAPAEIILIDDGSPNQMPDNIELPARCRLLRLKERGGKARALNIAAKQVTSDVIVCMDADTTVQSRDWRNLLSKFNNRSVGAVTGKIWSASAPCLLTRLQQIDYLAIISLIKAAETTWGGLMTVSGAFAAFNRKALLAVGGWSEDTAAEDIDISWRMQAAGWRLGYDSNWVCKVEMAPTYGALWRQRRRWSMGLGRTTRDCLVSSFSPNSSNLPVSIIVILSLTWVVLTLGCSAVSFVEFMQDFHVRSEWLNCTDVLAYVGISALLFATQFVCAAFIDRRSWDTYPVLLLLAVGYPVYFWLIQFTSFLVGFPQGFFRHDTGLWNRTVRQAETKEVLA